MLPLDEIGIFALATAIAAFWNLFIDMGLNQTLIREFSNDKNNFWKIFIGTLRLRIPVFIIGPLVFYIWVLFGQADFNAYLSVFLACSIQVLAIFDGVVISYLKGIEKQVEANFILMSNSALKLAFGVIFVIGQQFNTSSDIFLGLSFVKALMILISFLFLISVLKHQRNTKTFLADSFKKKLLNASLKFSGVNILTTVQNRLDWMIISFFLTNIDIANYSLTNKMYEFLQGFSGIALSILYPYLCSDTKTVTIQKIDIIMKFFLFFFSGIALLIGLFIENISHFLWQTKYDGSFPALKILMVGFPLSYLSGILYYSLISKYKEGAIFNILIFSTAFQALSNILLIPIFGIAAAAFGMLILWLMTASGNLYVYSKLNNLGIKHSLKKYSYIVPIIICSFLLIMIGNYLSCFVRVAIFLFAYFLLYMIIFNKEKVYSMLKGRQLEY